LFKKNYINLLYIIFLGGVSSYSLPPYNYYIVNFITFTLFFIFIFNKKKVRLTNISFFKYGWCFGFGYFLCSLYWIIISLTFDQNFYFLIPFAVVLIPSFLALFYGLVTYLFSIFYSKKIINSILIFSLFFGLIEFIRGSILTGFPWNLISFSFSNSIYFIQIISIIGTYSFNLICITLFTLPAVFVLKKSKKNIVFVSGFILVTVSFVIFGIYQIKEFNVLPSLKKTYSIKAISSNISLDRFYIEKNEKEIINELIDLSAPEKDKPTIFIWPEGIITESDLEDIHVYKDLFINNFSEDDLIVLGLNSSKVVNNKNLIFNSMAIFNNRLELIHKYDKVNLVPFGEFVPFENILSKIGFKTITNAYQSYSSGKVRKPFNLKNDKIDVNLLPLICYEIIYSGKLSKEKNYDYIINISEDGWFGSSIGPKQHFAHSIFRSIESGKYIIRSANNGISAIINPIGIVEKKIEFKKNGNIELIESKKLKSTIFMIYGNLIFLALILLYIFLIFSFNKLTNE
tara:strand:+ start:129 stop:1673 length:1545 start_codon:yes stop_codon:yes gene_type:complete